MMFSLILSLLILKQTTASKQPVAQIEQGKVLGVKCHSTDGEPFYSFYGIPYGEAPTGELRFKDPQPAKPWSTPFNATNNTIACAQITATGVVIDQEDCLVINVYTPKKRLDSAQSSSHSPGTDVFVYIHGGLFYRRGPNVGYGPERLLNKDIVVVVFAYRLGPFGYLSTGDSEAPGNYAFMDQLLALQWVQKNIRAFGGNPKKVTLVGQSSGAISAFLHLLSPKSKGLFRALIAESGSPFCPFAIENNPLQQATKLAKQLQCPTDTNSGLVSCLRTKTSKEIIEATNSLGGYSLTLMFVPVVENFTGGRFLTKSPLTILEEKDFPNIPVLTGLNKDEGAYLYPAVQNQFQVIDKTFYEKTLPYILMALGKYTTNLPELVAAVKGQYYDKIDTQNSTQVTQTGIDLLSDIAFKAPADAVIKLLVKANSNVHEYVFEYAGTPSKANFTGEKLVSHHDEVFYIFNDSTAGPLNSEDEKISDLFVNAWTNFASKLDPNPIKDTNWVSYTSSKSWYLRIFTQSTMQRNYLTDRMKFWNEDVPKIVAATK